MRSLLTLMWMTAVFSISHDAASAHNPRFNVSSPMNDDALCEFGYPDSDCYKMPRRIFEQVGFVLALEIKHASTISECSGFLWPRRFDGGITIITAAHCVISKITGDNTGRCDNPHQGAPESIHIQAPAMVDFGWESSIELRMGRELTCRWTLTRFIDWAFIHVPQTHPRYSNLNTVFVAYEQLRVRPGVIHEKPLHGIPNVWVAGYIGGALFAAQAIHAYVSMEGWLKFEDVSKHGWSGGPIWRPYHDIIGIVQQGRAGRYEEATILPDQAAMESQIRESINLKGKKKRNKKKKSVS